MTINKLFDKIVILKIKELIMLAQLSLSGFFENLNILSPLVLFISMPIGFIASAWATNTFFNYIRPDPDEITVVDRMGTFFLLVTLFGSYAYFVCSHLKE